MTELKLTSGVRDAHVVSNIPLVKLVKIRENELTVQLLLMMHTKKKAY